MLPHRRAEIKAEVAVIPPAPDRDRVQAIFDAVGIDRIGIRIYEAAKRIAARIVAVLRRFSAPHLEAIARLHRIRRLVEEGQAIRLRVDEIVADTRLRGEVEQAAVFLDAAGQGLQRDTDIAAARLLLKELVVEHVVVLVFELHIGLKGCIRGRRVDFSAVHIALDIGLQLKGRRIGIRVLRTRNADGL